MNTSAPQSQRGTSLVEVLVTMVILAIGLLALAGLQARLHVLQIESYQRAQALILLKDIASRITNNRYDATSYDTAGAIGTGAACPTATATRQQADITDWCNAIVGASETLGGGNVGSLVGGRGCIEDLGADEYLVTVVWQGLAPISAPPARGGTACGLNLYNGGVGSQCVNDRCRRAVSTVIRIPTLT